MGQKHTIDRDFRFSVNPARIKMQRRFRAEKGSPVPALMGNILTEKLRRC